MPRSVATNENISLKIYMNKENLIPPETSDIPGIIANVVRKVGEMLS